MGADPSSRSTPHEVEEPRRGKHANAIKDFERDFITYKLADELLTLRHVMDSSKSRHQKGTVKSEMDYIVRDGTWELVYYQM